MKNSDFYLALAIVAVSTLAGCGEAKAPTDSKNLPKDIRLVCNVEASTYFPALKKGYDSKGDIYILIQQYPDGVVTFSAEGKPEKFTVHGGKLDRDLSFSDNSNKDEWNYNRDYVFGTEHHELFKLNRISGELFYMNQNDKVRKIVSGTCEQAKGDWKKF